MEPLLSFSIEAVICNMPRVWLHVRPDESSIGFNTSLVRFNILPAISVSSHKNTKEDLEFVLLKLAFCIFLATSGSVSMKL